LHAIAKDIVGKSYTDEATKAAIQEMFVQYNYTACPHTAVGYLGLRDYLKAHNTPMYGVVLSTAHPAKFVDIVEEATEKTITLPESLHILLHRNKQAVSMPVSYPAFKAFLLS
jgi:threonine synthase